MTYYAKMKWFNYFLYLLLNGTLSLIKQNQSCKNHAPQNFTFFYEYNAPQNYKPPHARMKQKSVGSIFTIPLD